MLALAPVLVRVLVLEQCQPRAGEEKPSDDIPKTLNQRPLSRLGSHAEAVVDFLGSCSPTDGSAHAIRLLLLPVIGSPPTLLVASAA